MVQVFLAISIHSLGTDKKNPNDDGLLCYSNLFNPWIWFSFISDFFFGTGGGGWSFSRIISLGIRICCWLCFSFSNWKVLYHLILASVVSDQKSVIWISVLWCCFSLAAFKIFSLVFWSLIMMSWCELL